MKLILLMMVITALMGCNDSARGTRPPADNTIVKDTAAKDTSVIHE